jgi:iron complex outermembrane receptor protein
MRHDQEVTYCGKRLRLGDFRAAGISLIALAAGCLTGGSVWAQTQGASVAAQPVQSTEGVEEIIVTARQRSETLQSTPVSVSAINPMLLETTNAPTISDISGEVPNLFIQRQPSGASAAAISIRGIAFADIEKSFDPAVGVVVDGVYIGTNTGQLLDAFDVASLEVLRGPQGTLFGRNTTGGVINIRRTRPTGEFGGDAEISYGNYNTARERIVLNTPLVKDILALKVFEDHNSTDGYLYDVTTHQHAPQNTSDNYGLALLYTPGTSFQALLTLEEQSSRGTTANSSGNQTGDLVCRAAPAVQCNRNYTTDLYTIFSEFVPPSTYSSPAATLEMTYDLNDDFELKSITGIRTSKEYTTQDFDATSVPFYETIRNQQYRQFSEELRLSGKITDTIDIVSGLYYFDNRYSIQQTTLLGPLLGNRVTNQFASQTANSYAGYVDVNWQFADKFRLTIGGRMTDDDKNFANAFPGTFSVQASHSWSKFTPKASLDYRPTDTMLLYVSYAEGYRTGGFNGRAATASTSTEYYQPETVNTYEVGMKNELFDKRMTLDLAGFYSDFSNKQESIIRLTPPGSPTPNETVVANAASATIYGFEAESTVHPMKGLTLNASLGYLHSKYDSFKTLNATTLQPIDLSGLSLIFNPTLTASFGGTYVMPTAIGDVTFLANYRHIDSYYTSIGADPSNPNPYAPTQNYLLSKTLPYNPVDASVSLDMDVGSVKPRLTAYIRNAFDERGMSTVTIVAGLFKSVTPREPRTFGGTVGLKF